MFASYKNKPTPSTKKLFIKCPQCRQTNLSVDLVRSNHNFKHIICTYEYPDGRACNFHIKEDLTTGELILPN